MPSPQIMAFAKQSGKSASEIEVLWDKAKASAAAQGHKEDYAYITGILKKMLKLESVDSMIRQVAEGAVSAEVIRQALLEAEGAGLKLMQKISSLPAHKKVRRRFLDHRSRISISAQMGIATEVYMLAAHMLDHGTTPTVPPLLAAGLKKTRSYYGAHGIGGGPDMDAALKDFVEDLVMRIAEERKESVAPQGTVRGLMQGY